MPSDPPESIPLFRTVTRRRLALGLGAIGGLYVAVAIALQAGLETFGWSILAMSAGSLLAAIVFGALRSGTLTIIVAGILPLILWLGVWGTYSLHRDLLGGAFALTVAWPITRLLSRQRDEVRRQQNVDPDLDRPHRRFMRRYVLVGFLWIWMTNSALDVFFESESEPRDRVPLLEARAKDGPRRNLRVGVALSGGGYRAALMHAGVLAELDAMRVPVTAISSVSGGSIIGSYYATGGAPENFRDAIVGGRLHLKRDMADIHNALRLPLPMELPYLDVQLFPWHRFGRVDVQANLVDRVFLGDTRLRDMVDPVRPRLQICATDLRSGTAVGLAADGVAIRSATRPAKNRSAGAILYEVDREFHPAIDPSTKVASLVAASGAFPGAFNGVDIVLPATSQRDAMPLLLADGGIMDNWGVGLLLDRHWAAGPRDPWRIDLLIVSAGGRIFEVGEDIPEPEQLRRAIDVIYETAGWRPVEIAEAIDRPPMLLLQPADAARDSVEFLAFAETTTLTDTFSEVEGKRLFDLGRMLVRNIAGDLDGLVRPKTETPW